MNAGSSSCRPRWLNSSNALHRARMLKQYVAMAAAAAAAAAERGRGMRSCRHSSRPSFFWRGAYHFREGDKRVPRDVIDANHRLIRRGLDACPECRPSLPTTDELRRWRELSHDSLLRRPA